MKTFLLCTSTLILTLALNVNAADGTGSTCVNAAGEDIQFEPELIEKEILSQTTCYQAKAVAENCGLGSSGDVSTAGYAYTICEKELAKAKPSKSNQRLLNTMITTCDKTYENQEGTMYMSFNAFCKLSAINWILNISSNK